MGWNLRHVQSKPTLATYPVLFTASSGGVALCINPLLVMSFTVLELLAATLFPYNRIRIQNLS
ncbi:uncharacterized protein K460DRAFT_365155 [Cucurbitaria berberidis CBS 394.84]|uniref:Uncharacterized protein n=1 Tax=Cucurbitaria berberidis CBS 394.84 TaxID=1168544 RepID=A0A9P4GQ85_9PLEO|nr:uncharacterized protein K460DRAFT_365155 [Cucurbitaria berberidis CBS 394.84]KAF1849265.1 hypothetical protein K460DRAFT_365155 [Cucurbitaria berberidis CBS 394.84]